MDQGSDAEEDLDAKYERLQAAAAEAATTAPAQPTHADDVPGAALSELPGWGEEATDRDSPNSKNRKYVSAADPAGKRNAKKHRTSDLAASAAAAAAVVAEPAHPQLVTSGALSEDAPAGLHSTCLATCLSCCKCHFQYPRPASGPLGRH